MTIEFESRRAGAAIAGALLALSFSAPALAHDPGPKKEIVIKRIGPDGKEVRVHPAEFSRLTMKCDGDKAESDVTAGEGKEKFRTRVVVCTRDGKPGSLETRRKLAEALERARNDLGTRMPAERRAEAIAALEREIARLRADDGKQVTRWAGALAPPPNKEKTELRSDLERMRTDLQRMREEVRREVRETLRREGVH